MSAPAAATKPQKGRNFWELLTAAALDDLLRYCIGTYKLKKYHTWTLKKVRVATATATCTFKRSRPISIIHTYLYLFFMLKKKKA